MGYSTSHKGYKCLSPSGRVYISKDVIFNESKFPYGDLFESSSPSSQSNSSLTLHYFPPIPIIQPSTNPQPSSDFVQSSRTAQTDQSNVDLSIHLTEQSTVSPFSDQLRIHTLISSSHFTSQTTKYISHANRIEVWNSFTKS